ncbi:MAG: cytochrome b/b6 domain-containing protein [Maricaulaceae bacterium]
MSEAASTSPVQRDVLVWDLPTRLFHWSLVALIVVAWFTGEEDGGAAVVHRIAGETVAGLIVFRLAWGFLGGQHARFADFAAGPTAIVNHLRDLFSTTPKRHLGHNPLGGLAVFLLLANVAVIALTGLFSSGDENVGPFAGMWGLELSEVHEVAFRVLQALVVVHIFGVIAESWKAKDGLVPAMITGRKKRGASEPADDAARASLRALIIAVALGLIVTGALVIQPPATGAFSEEHERDLDD